MSMTEGGASRKLSAARELWRATETKDENMTESEARRKIAAARELLDMSEKLIGHENYSRYRSEVLNAESLKHYRIAINRLLLEVERG